MSRFILYEAQAPVAFSNTNTDWLRANIAKVGRSQNVIFEFHVQTDDGQRIRMDWYMQFFNTGSEKLYRPLTFSGGLTTLNSGNVDEIDQPVAVPTTRVREQSEEAGGLGVINHYDVVRTFRVPAAGTTAVIRRKAFPMVVSSPWVSLNLTLTYEAGAPGAGLPHIGIAAYFEGYAREDNDNFFAG